MLKRKFLVALGTVLAILAVPAAASAGWTHSGVELKTGENPQLSAVGSFRFEGELGGIECETNSQFTFTGGQTTGHITKFEPNGTATAKCKTLGLFPLIGCTRMEAMTNTNLPWTMHRVSGQPKIQVTTGTIHYTVFNDSGMHCAIPQITWNPGNITMDIKDAETNAIATFQLSGQLETSEGEAIEITGSQSVTPASTYGMT